MSNLESYKKHIFPVGYTFSSYKVLEFKLKTGYLVKCDCGHEVIMTAFQIKKNVKCQFCNINNVLGKKINSLLFLEYLGKQIFKCLCDCGNICTARRRRISCGCHLKKKIKEKALSNVGEKIGYFKIMSYVGPDEKGRSIYNVKCKCGKTFASEKCKLNFVNSCGCRINSNYARGSRQGNSKISEIQAYQIKEMFLTGLYSRREIVEMFDVSSAIVDSLINGKTWKHIKLDSSKIKESPFKHLYERRKRKINEGEVYGKWTVLNKSKSSTRHSYHTCKCECGVIKDVVSSSLLSGKSTKCRDCNTKNLIELIRRKSV